MLITTSLDLTGHVVDVAGPLGVAVHVAPDLSVARRWLDRSRLVLIGADQLDTVTPAVFSPDRQGFVITDISASDSSVITTHEKRANHTISD